jgi:hypothetical protein
VGHDLLMRSQQDNNDYDSKQTSVAAGGSFTFGSMSGSGYINASQDKMKSRFDSVAEQTGLYAGDGGFDITVGITPSLMARLSRLPPRQIKTASIPERWASATSITKRISKPALRHQHERRRVASVTSSRATCRAE